MSRQATAEKMVAMCDEGIAAEFREELAALLSAQDESYSSLARRCGVSRQSIRDYEEGRALPSVVALVRLAAGLGVGAGRLLGRWG